MADSETYRADPRRNFISAFCTHLLEMKGRIPGKRFRRRESCSHDRRGGGIRRIRAAAQKKPSGGTTDLPNFRLTT